MDDQIETGKYRKLIKIFQTLKKEDNFALILKFFYVIMGAFFSATIFITFINPIIINSIMAIKGKSANIKVSTLPTISRPNFRDIKKAVIARNVFNNEGIFPEETDDTKKPPEKTPILDANSPCLPSKLKLTLTGTIVLSEQAHSVAILQEPGIDEADIYHVNDLVIGYEKVRVAEIYRNRVVFNNDGHKECIEIILEDKERNPAYNPAANSSNAASEGDGGPVFLQASWVQEELGNGFEKILQSARLIPTLDDQIQGFKVFAIRKGTLFDKIGLQDGDIVTQVNETVMTPEHGFALYQALLDEWNINIRVLRGGKTPTNINVQIKK